MNFLRSNTPTIVRKIQNVKIERSQDVGILIMPTDASDKIFEFGSKYSTAEIAIFGKVLYGELNENVVIGVLHTIYTIPTEITSASVDYDNSDIFTIGNKIKQDIPPEVKQFMVDIGIRKLKNGCNFSCHKHPSRSRFSGMGGDECISSDSPGILRRYQDYNGYSFDVVFGPEYAGHYNWGELRIQRVQTSSHPELFAQGKYRELRSILVEEIADPVLEDQINILAYNFNRYDVTKSRLIQKIINVAKDHEVFSIDVKHVLKEKHMKHKPIRNNYYTYKPHRFDPLDPYEYDLIP